MANPVEPWPMATVNELKARWPDFPVGGEEHAGVLLEDASQFIIDVCPTAVKASVSTRRRVVCAVVKRAMQAESSDLSGMESRDLTTGPFSVNEKPVNPNGDFYLTKQEKIALGIGGAARAGSVDMTAVAEVESQ